MSVHALIVPCPRGLHARDKVLAQRSAARAALAELGLSEPLADPDGVPQHSQGHYWSVSHTEGAAAAVLSEHPVGIDLEHEREISPRLLERFLGADEPKMAPLTAWTAKEAVLKKTRVGLVGLPRCRILHWEAAQRLRVLLDGREHSVALAQHGAWHAALACDAEPLSPTWEWRT